MSVLAVAEGYLEASPDVAGGKPRIAGRRITVQNIVVWHIHLGRSVDEIAQEYDLNLAQIYAALTYYFDHQQEIEASLQNEQAAVNHLRKHSHSLLRERLASYGSEQNPISD
jgi:uncharacterized protein (DUF433 family)